eukprot:m.329400 g.329400  ORF g.329400 m.329400 type:complete len:377 (-) comp16507_c1_seq6:9-1139(-)
MSTSGGGSCRVSLQTPHSIWACRMTHKRIPCGSTRMPQSFRGTLSPRLKRATRSGTWLPRASNSTRRERPAHRLARPQRPAATRPRPRSGATCGRCGKVRSTHRVSSRGGSLAHRDRWSTWLKQMATTALATAIRSAGLTGQARSLGNAPSGQGQSRLTSGPRRSAGASRPPTGATAATQGRARLLVAPPVAPRRPITASLRHPRHPSTLLPRLIPRPWPTSRHTVGRSVAQELSGVRCFAGGILTGEKDHSWFTRPRAPYPMQRRSTAVATLQERLRVAVDTFCRSTPPVRGTAGRWSWWGTCRGPEDARRSGRCGAAGLRGTLRSESTRSTSRATATVPSRCSSVLFGSGELGGIGPACLSTVTSQQKLPTLAV